MANEREHFDTSRQFQAFYDEALRRVGARAPQPTLGQKVNDYRRETLRNLKRTFLPPHMIFIRSTAVVCRATRWAYLNRKSSVLALMRPTIPRMSLPASFARLKNWTNTANSK